MTDDVYKEFGLSEFDVTKWQEDNNLKHLKPKAACQLYLSIVKGKTFKPPNPTMTVVEIWEKINAISTGAEEAPNNNRLYIGIKDLDVVARFRDNAYTGCPICNKSKKNLKKNHCTDHDGLTDLEELHITEWAAYDGNEEFTFTLFPTLSAKYPQEKLLGARVYVEGYIDLTKDPITLIVNNFREVVGGGLKGKGSFVDEDEDDLDVDRSDVEIEGFDDEDDIDIGVEDDTSNPFLDEDDDVIVAETVLADSDMAVELREYMDEMLSGFAKATPAPKASVVRVMKTWVKEEYPNEFENIDEAEPQLWEIIKGLYTEKNGQILYKGE
jgi:hypothetical protein